MLESPNAPPASRKHELLIVALVFLVFSLAAALTTNDYGLAWDETTDIDSTAAVVAWAKDSLGPRFSSDALARGWGGDWRHGPVTRAANAASWIVFSRFSRDPWFRGVTSYRLGTALFFGLLGALVAVVASRLAGPSAALCAAAMLTGMPRLFAHAHFCATDILAALLFFAAAAALWKALRSPAWAAVAGILIAATATAKESGWLLVPMATVLVLCARPRGWWGRALLAAGTALFAFLLFHPSWWHSPLAELRRYAQYLGLGPRHAESAWTLYFFRRYTFSPPWHYPFVMLATTLTLPALAAAIAGLSGAVWMRNARIAWFTLPGLFIPAVFALPQVPVYDAERLLLPAVGFLAVAGGLAAAAVAARLPGIARPTALDVFVLVFPLMLWRMHPGEAVYFNPLIGGPAGAVARGMDLDYWGSTVDRAFIHGMSTTLPPGVRLTALGYNSDNLETYKRLGLLRNDIQIVDYGVPAQVILLGSRPGVFDSLGWFLYQKGRPVVARRIGGALTAGVFAGAVRREPAP